MREEVSMGGMWPRIYNLAERRVSARGQVWAQGISGFSGNLVPGWAEALVNTCKGEMGPHLTETRARPLPRTEACPREPQALSHGASGPPKPAPLPHW